MAKGPSGGCFDANFTNLPSFEQCIRDQALAKMRYMSPTQAALFTFIYGFISLLGALGNGLVIFVVARKPEMRTTRNVFIVNLALSNFFLALILVPFLWLPTYRIEFPYGAFVCKLAQAFPSTNIFCSALTISVIAVDRYYVIVRARLGPGHMKTAQAVLIAGAIWFISLALSVLYFMHFHTKDYSLPNQLIPENLMHESGGRDILLFQRCELKPSPCVKLQNDGSFAQGYTQACYRFYETALGALTAAFIYFVPMPVLVIFSCLLSRYLARSHRQQSSLRHHVCIPMATAAAGASDQDRTSSLGAALITAANSIMGRRHNDRTTFTSANSHSAAFRRRSRTTSLLFAMTCSNAILWLPFVVISMIIQLAPNEITISFQNELRQLDDVAKLISMLSTCVNPFLYGYLNTNFNREFKLILNQCCPCCVINNFSSHSGRSTSAVVSLRSSQRRSAEFTLYKAPDLNSSNPDSATFGHYSSGGFIGATMTGRMIATDLEDVADSL